MKGRADENRNGIEETKWDVPCCRGGRNLTGEVKEFYDVEGIEEKRCSVAEGGPATLLRSRLAGFEVGHGQIRLRKVFFGEKPDLDVDAVESVDVGSMAAC